ncbi:MAG: hypothetical protein IKB06_03030 [Clostridia bacterium]|nr:hypothetical protein [Clostridia bacterium]
MISKKADNLWQQMFNEDKDIRKFSYNDKIVVDKNPTDKIYKFSGNKKQAVGELEIKTDKKGVAKIQYNDVFHDKHIIPLEMIINELKEIKKPDINEDTYNQVRKILDKIYICKMLKSEDRDLMDSRKRNSTNVVDVVETNYWKRTNSGIPIEIVDWENIKKQIKEKQKAVK